MQFHKKQPKRVKYFRIVQFKKRNPAETITGITYYREIALVSGLCFFRGHVVIFYTLFGFIRIKLFHRMSFFSGFSSVCVLLPVGSSAEVRVAVCCQEN